MGARPPGLLDSLRSRRAVRRWRQAAAGADGMDAADLAQLAPRARAVADHAGQILRAAERRLGGAAGHPVERPPQSDWAWRPAPWAEALDRPAAAGIDPGHVVAPGIVLFHDCPLREITLRQARATRAEAPAPWMLEVDTLGFEGGFLSLALDLPEEARHGFRPSQIVALTVRLWQEHPARLSARLNLRHGPNTEQLAAELDPPGRPRDPRRAEFDLGMLEFNPARLEAAWIDLILDRPAMNLVRFEDVTLSRRHRADL